MDLILKTNGFEFGIHWIWWVVAVGLGGGVRRIEKRDGLNRPLRVVLYGGLPTDCGRFVALLSHIDGLLEDGAALTIVQPNLEGIGLFSDAIVLRGEQVDGTFHVEVGLIIAVDGFIIHESVFLACGDRASIVGHDFNQAAVKQVFVDTACDLCQVNGEVGLVHDASPTCSAATPCSYNATVACGTAADAFV